MKLSTPITQGCFLTLACISTPAVSVETFWNETSGTCSGSYVDVSCWSTAVIPVLADSAIWDLDHASPYTVGFSIDVTNFQAQIQNDDVVWDLNGNTYSLTSLAAGTQSLLIGTSNVDVGNLKITDGTVEAGVVSIGGRGSSDTGASGTLTVDGANLILANGRNTTVGSSGDGTMAILNGGAVDTGGSAFVGIRDGVNSTVTIDGAGSSWDVSRQFTVGSNTGSVGEIIITNGGSFSANTSNISTTAGIGSFGTGSVTVDGAGSNFLVRKSIILGVRAGGDGTLTVKNGGHAGIEGAILDDSGTGTINLDGGTITTGSNSISVDNFNIANASGTNAAYTVANGEQVLTDNTTVGNGGTGSLTVETGGLFNADVQLEIGATSTVNLDGGTINADSLVMPAGSIFNFTGGDLNIVNGLNAIAGTFNHLDGNVQINGGIVNSRLEANSIIPGANPRLTLSDVSANSPNDLESGKTGKGTVRVTSGSDVTTPNGVVGESAGSDGTVEVSGANTKWKNTGNVTVGDNGSGALRVKDGARVENNRAELGRNAGSIGSVVVEGFGTVWSNAESVTVGGTNGGVAGGSGSVMVMPGSTVEVGDTLDIKNTGSVELNGGRINTKHLKASADTLDFMDGELNVKDGTFDNGKPSLALDGLNALSNPKLVLDNSSTSFANDVTVGDDMNATLELIGGTSVTSANAKFGRKTGSDGSATVSGAGTSLSNTSNTTVGELGRGSLMIDNGASLSNANTEIAASAGSIGEVIVDGSGTTLTSSDSVYIGGTSSGTGGSGKFSIKNGGSANVTNDVDIKTGGTLELRTGTLTSQNIFNKGRIEGIGNLAADVFNTSGGLVGPGQSPGTLNITGNYTQDANSSLLIEIGGLLAGTEYDVFNISDTATLAGLLEVQLYDLGSGLFLPSLGDSFDILTAETLTGQFDLLTLANPGFGLDWQVDYLFDEFGSTDVVRLSVVTSAVPVPAAVWLFSSGLMGLVLTGRRRLH